MRVATGAKTDAYKVFKGMLEGGNPPDDWAALYKAASEPAAVARLASAAPTNPNTMTACSH